MKPSLLTSLLNAAGGLGLAAGALLWPTVSQAQGFCYMVDPNGRVINLDDLCASGGASQRSPSQSETRGVNSTQPSPASQERGFTILGTPADANSNEATGETPSDFVDAESPGNESRGDEFRDDEFRDGEPVGEEPVGEEPVGEEPVGEEPVDRQRRPGISVNESRGDEFRDGEPVGEESVDRQRRPGVPVNESRDDESRGDEFRDGEPVGEESVDRQRRPGIPVNESRDDEFRGGEPVGEQPDRQRRPGIPVEEITIPGIEVPQIPAPVAPRSSTSAP